MISKHEREKLKQWYADAHRTGRIIADSTGTINRVGTYEEWLEYMVIRRSELLEQSAAYSEHLEAALRQAHDYLYEKGDVIAALNILGVLESEAE